MLKCHSVLASHS